MELENFKALWQKKTISSAIQNEAKIKPSVDMNVTNEIAKMNARNLSSAKFSEATTSFLFGVLGFALILQFFLPAHIGSLKDAMPAFIVFAIFGIVASHLTNESKRIFMVDPRDNVHTTISKLVRRWKRWYLKSNFIMAVVLPPVFYVFLFIMLQTFHFQLTTEMHWGVSILLAIALMIATHVHYRKNYISKIESLRRSLDELQNESFS